MIRGILITAVLGFSGAASAVVDCQKFANSEVEVKELRRGDILNKENWKSIDVIVAFSREQCEGAVEQTLYEIEGEFYWQFRTAEDSCDGGNSYGSLMTYDLKTAVAHMYDGDWYCKEDWDDQNIASNYRCNSGAEELAEKKMKDFGLDFKVSDSSLEIRKPYIWSFVNVVGTIANKNDKPASVQVLTRLDTCEYDRVSIEKLNL